MQSQVVLPFLILCNIYFTTYTHMYYILYFTCTYMSTCCGFISVLNFKFYTLMSILFSFIFLYFSKFWYFAWFWVEMLGILGTCFSGILVYHLPPWPTLTCCGFISVLNFKFCTLTSFLFSFILDYSRIKDVNIISLLTG